MSGAPPARRRPRLDAFFRERIGPVIGHDYQHVYDLGGDRQLWLFQDTFIDHTGNATRLDQASFAHNTAMVQHGRCFTLLHRGTADRAAVVRARHRRADPEPLVLAARRRGRRRSARTCSGPRWSRPPTRAARRARLGAGAHVAGDVRRGDAGAHVVPAGAGRPACTRSTGSPWRATPSTRTCSATRSTRTSPTRAATTPARARRPRMYLARVPRGALGAAPEFRTADGWSADPGARCRSSSGTTPRTRCSRGSSTAAGSRSTKVDGYWGDDLAIDVAEQPWGPWTTVSRRPLAPRGGDPLMNTYHAHLVPWTDGGLVVSVSQNARDMLRDAWPHPARYRLQFISHAMPERTSAAEHDEHQHQHDEPSTTTTAPTVETTTTTLAPATTTTEAPTTTQAATTTVVTTTTSPRRATRPRRRRCRRHRPPPRRARRRQRPAERRLADISTPSPSGAPSARVTIVDVRILFSSRPDVRPRQHDPPARRRGAATPATTSSSRPVPSSCRTSPPTASTTWSDRDDARRGGRTRRAVARVLRDDRARHVPPTSCRAPSPGVRISSSTRRWSSPARSRPR